MHTRLYGRAWREISRKMKIWSFQSDSCIDTLASGKIYYADINKSDLIIEERAEEGGDTIFLDSYNFMTKHMKQNVNPLIPAEYSEIFLEISAPVWGWYKTNGKNSRPDRRTYLFKDMDTEGVSLIHLDVPDEYVTLTDFYLWETFAINKTKFYDKIISATSVLVCLKKTRNTANT